MKAVRLHTLPSAAPEIPLQPASYDIWDKKYRLRSKPDYIYIDQRVEDQDPIWFPPSPTPTRRCIRVVWTNTT